MKKTILLATTLIITSLFNISCDTDDGPNCPDALTGELTQTESDFAGEWTLKSIVAEDEVDLTDDDTDNPSTDIFNQYTACQQDAIYEFNNDRSYIFKQGNTATNCSNKQTLDGTWKLTNSTLVFAGNCSLQSVNIDLNNDSTEFTIDSNFNFVDVNDNEINSDVVLTYEKTITD